MNYKFLLLGVLMIAVGTFGAYKYFSPVASESEQRYLSSLNQDGHILNSDDLHTESIAMVDDQREEVTLDTSVEITPTATPVDDPVPADELLTSPEPDPEQEPVIESLPEPAPEEIVINPEPQPMPEPEPQPSGFTLAEVAIHDDASSCWTVVNGGVYDITSYVSKHPGGERRILKICGIDGTDAFTDQHGGAGRPERTLNSFFIGELI